MLNPDGKTLESFTTSGISTEARQRIGNPPQGLGILGLVIHKGHSIRLADLQEHPASRGFPPNHPPMRTFLGVPVVGKRGVLGDLYLTEKLGGEEFSEEDEHLAHLLAAMAAAAIENARLHEESARLLEEVQQLQRSRERFFAMVNHELRNALAAVYGWSEMLVRKKDPQTVPRAAFEVLESAEQAMELINDLLDLSRLDEDRLKPKFQEVDCRRIIRQAVARATPAAEAKQITLRIETAPGLGSCHTDAHRMEQILLNLLGNAVRHAPNGSEVVVTGGSEAANAVFRVEDEGPGIPDDEIERIFDVYVTKAGDERMGSGLGLPLSRRLARLLGGELYAVARPGRGGCFVLELPLTVARE
jgi:signal transduction histidine kinase